MVFSSIQHLCLHSQNSLNLSYQPGNYTAPHYATARYPTHNVPKTEKRGVISTNEIRTEGNNVARLHPLYTVPPFTVSS